MGGAATTTTKKTRFLRKTLVVALFATIQWNAIAFIQHSGIAFVPHTSRVLISTTNKHAAPWVAVSLTNPAVLRMGRDGGEDSTDASAFFLNRVLQNPWTTTTPLPNTKVAAQTNDAVQSSLSSPTTTLPPGLVALQTVVQPIQDKLDDASADWALSYADLRPDDSSTVPGQAFLATNALYMIAGLVLTMQGDIWFGTMTEICSIASFLYHYTQLEARGETKAPTVRLAVLVDYICAFISLGTATAYLVPMMFNDASIDMFVAAALSVAFLGLSWVYETGRPYMFFHSLWHVFGAYAGLLIGSAHNHVPLPTILPPIPTLF